jgi:hypothetical protein
MPRAAATAASGRTLQPAPQLHRRRDRERGTDLTADTTGGDARHPTKTITTAGATTAPDGHRTDLASRHSEIANPASARNYALDLALRNPNPKTPFVRPT